MPAVDTIAEYVWASALLGYQHGDLTGHPGDVHGWYAAEEGLDLRVLEAERAALASAVSSAEQAVQRQEDQVRRLPGVWQGGGAQASREFLVRHAATSGHVVTALRTAADALAELRDCLWRAIDRKVEAAVEIEGRHAAQRGPWLAAARTVRTGVGDRDTASELIDLEVKPFVANDIGGDWLTAMRAGTTAVTEAYDVAVAALRSRPVTVFSVPGDLGPVWTPVAAPPPAATPAGIGVAATPPAYSPAGQSIPSIPASTMAAPTIPAAADPAAPPSPTLASPPPGFGSAPGGGLPDLGGGLSGAGLSGLSGVGQRLADMFGGLIGSSGDTTPADLKGPFGEAPEALDDESEDVVAEDDPEDKSEDEDDEEVAGDEAGDDEDTDGEDDAPDADADADPVESTAADEASQPVAAPVVVPPVDPVPPPLPVAEPQAAEGVPARTPCEIAADELPQVGG